jgi:uncharacterized membrane protein YebE (DUF533 family)
MNIEKLLGKLLQEATGLGGNTQGKTSLVNSLTKQLTSGQGLMTAIGLGVGALEILRSGKQGAVAGMLPKAAPVPPVPPIPRPATPPPPSTPLDEQEIARRLIRVMVGAAHADGVLDAQEEQNIVERLQAADLDQEEKRFLLEELHHPRPIAELTHGIQDLRLAQTMYAVALSAIEVNTASERRWLDELGASLGLSGEIRRFIEATR